MQPNGCTPIAGMLEWAAHTTQARRSGMPSVGHQCVDRLPSTRWAQKFPSAVSFRVSVLRVKSATARVKRRFSRSVF